MLINGRTADEIKRGIKCHVSWGDCSTECPYDNVRNKPAHECIQSMTKDALALIERLEAAQPKWISVKERLPEEDGEYLVLKVHNYRKDDGYMAQEVALFLRTRDPEWVVGNLCEVTHWMPLPQPPEVSE